jgi:hypothetical protein
LLKDSRWDEKANPKTTQTTPKNEPQHSSL